MAGEWNQTTLGSIAAKDGYGLVDGPFGSNLPASCYTQRGIPVIRGSNLTLGTSRFRAGEFVFVSRETAQRLARSLCRPFDIVFTKKGTLGQTGLVPDGGPYDLYLLSSNQMKLTVDQRQADPLFVYYFVSSSASTRKIIQDSEATGVPKTNVTYLRNFPITLPPLPEQRAIAHILSTLDDKIELNRRMNETLEAMARALFKSWFVDFDPVRAKAEGHNPGLPKPLADLFPDSFADSELGEIPKGWEVKLLSELCTLGRGASPRPINDYMNGEVPWVKIADATAAGGPFLFETKERLKTAGVDKSVMVAPGDLILSNSATCGVPMFVELHGCIHDGWLYFKNLRSISKLYLFHVLIELAEHLVHIADGSVQKNLNTELVGRQYVLVPPQAVVAAFDKQATTWFTRMRDNGIESRTLAALRDTLLPKLISGELGIGHTERFIGGSD